MMHFRLATKKYFPYGIFRWCTYGWFLIFLIASVFILVPVDIALNFVERIPPSKIEGASEQARRPVRPSKFGGVVGLSSCMLPEAFESKSKEFCYDLRGTPLLILHGSLDRY